MKLQPTAESFSEWFALRMNLVPIPLLHGQLFPMLSKAVLTSADRGIFRAIFAGNDTPEKVAAACGLSRLPVGQLLQTLCALGYIRQRKGRYTIASAMRKWLSEDSWTDLSDLLIYNNRVVWKWMEHLDTYLETGVGVDYHQLFDKEEWQLYQNAMRAVARAEVKEFAQKCPVPKNAQYVLDIGGAHGLHMEALCERHPKIVAQLLDLPGAIGAQPAIASRYMEIISGDVLTTDLGEQRFDVVLMSSLAHHFSSEENQQIAKKVAASLRPGGIYIVNEFINAGEHTNTSSLVEASSNLFFGVTSTSGTWTIDETRQWQLEAGLIPLKAIGYRAIPGRYQLPARKK